MKSIQWGKVLTSKTIWVNLILFLIYVTSWDQLTQYISPIRISEIHVLLNIILRFLTGDSLFKQEVDAVNKKEPTAN